MGLEGSGGGADLPRADKFVSGNRAEDGVAVSFFFEKHDQSLDAREIIALEPHLSLRSGV